MLLKKLHILMFLVYYSSWAEETEIDLGSGDRCSGFGGKAGFSWIFNLSPWSSSLTSTMCMDPSTVSIISGCSKPELSTTCTSDL